MSKEKRRVPKLRFPGFTEDWEQRKLGSIGSTYTGLSGKTKEDFGHGEAQYITYLNVFQNTISNITMTDKVEIDTTQTEVKYGDVLFTTSSETPEEVGMSSVWLGDTPNTYLNSFCFGFRPKQKIDLYFLGYSLRAPYMRDKIKILAQGISRYNISKNKVMELEISLPNNEEQNLLGNFLRHIDLIITLHQRKLNNLKLKKKALLQKLFPKNGERYPELRFPGFTDAWEQRKLNDFVTIRRGLTYKPSDIAENGIRVLRSSNIDEDQFIKSNDDVFVNLAAVNIPFAKNGDILITSANGSNRLVGKHTIINDVAENSAVPGGFMLLAESNNPLFTDALLSSNWYKRFINTYVAGGNGAIGNLNKSDLESQSVMVPSEHEQTKIGQWYDNINQLITLHQRKLDHLQLQKKALLQQMFV
ncbi:restriction endonuclease subunit S [Veillonella parvula]|uniref:restriction endonuclease subunit S n=1 Tax=Veillonella parvula TaxID=29466 RepID=UPI00241FD93A|nr:restriction endonuclease subunit S [Veillonella parvula]MBS7177505.1 restriction endonuclease subunit S [Veillonella parvula]